MLDEPIGEEALYIQDTARQMTNQLGRDGAIRRVTRIMAQDRTIARREFWVAVLKKLNGPD